MNLVTAMIPAIGDGKEGLSRKRLQNTTLFRNSLRGAQWTNVVRLV